MFESPYARLGLCWLMAAVAVGRRKAEEDVNGHRDGHIPPLPGHGTATLGRRPEAIDVGKRVQPVNCQRKVGKSYLTAKILTMLAEQNLADLVILACGGSGPYEAPMSKYYDPRFCFREWPEEMFNVLWRQQGELLAAGRKRSVVIIIDDINMNSSANV